jgi:hypothetical protein
VVLDGARPSDREYEILTKRIELGPEDILWLQEKATDANWMVRMKAVWVLGRSGCRAAAWSIWMASEVEELDGAYASMVVTLGRMGTVARPYLIRLLEDRGLDPPLLMALAQASGVPVEESYYSGFEGPADEWWRGPGKAELGSRVPQHPVRPAPEVEVR